MDIVNIAKEVILKEIPKVLVIYLFGSYANKTQSKKSDLDLAILSTQKIEKKKLWDISQKIAAKTNTEVDLIDLQDASIVFAFQIINESKVIYCLNENKKAFFENKIDSMYLRLNDTRKDIIENIVKRKGVY